MVASKLQMHVSPLPSKISTKFQRLYLCFLGSSFPMGLTRQHCDRTESGKIQDGGLKTSNACISASTQVINALPMATPMFLESSIPTGLGRIMRAQTGRKLKRWQVVNFKYADVPPCNQNFSYHMGVFTRKQVSLTFAEHFVLPISGLVAHHSHKFQLNAGPRKRRYSRWNSVDILSESAETRN